MAVPRNRGLWANGQPIAPGSRIPVSREHFEEQAMDHANPHGIPRPKLPLSTQVSTMGNMIAAGIKRMVMGDRTPSSMVESMDAVNPPAPFVDPDPTSAYGIARPRIPVKKDL